MRLPPWLPRAATTAGVLGLTVFLVLWLSGVFTPKTPPGPPAGVLRAAPAAKRLQVATRELPVVEEAVGTIQAVQEARIAARILGRVRALHVEKAGQPVQAGALLVELDDADLIARLGVARAQAKSAEEVLAQAKRDLERIQALFEQKIAAPDQLDRERSRATQAEAEADRSKQAVRAAETELAYTRITAPFAGIVVDKLVDRGDTVTPGQLLMVLYDPTRMQLVASVREQLARALRIGQEVEVVIDALALRCHGQLAQIVPRSEGGSRSFDVKVTGPCPDGIYSGMFGKLVVPLGTRKAILVPATAVRAIGQIDLVQVVLPDGGLLRRFVVVGAARGDEVEILSGLAAGETILIEP